MPALTQRFMPEGATLASGVREPGALADNGVGIYLNLDPAVSLDVDYTADALPESASPAWTKSGTQSASVAGGELTLSDTSGADSIGYDRAEAGADTASSALLGARMKLTADDGGAISNILDIRDGTREVGIGLHTDGIVVNDFAGEKPFELGDDRIDTSIYHTYEICKVTNVRMDLYIDGRYALSVPYSALRSLAGNDGFLFGMFSNARTSTAVYDRVYYKISTLWPSDSPTFDKDFDSGSNDTVWDMSTIKMVENLFGEEGNVKYKYGAGNAAAPALNGSFLTEAQIQSEADPTGRFLRIQGQLNGDGSQDAGWGGFEIAMTTAAGGFVAQRPLVHQNIGTY